MLSMSSAYHLETDGQTESVNQVIEDMLRAYYSQQPQNWLWYLLLVEFAYNSSQHRSLGMSPFKALYAQDCLAPMRLANPNLSIPVAKQTLEEMEKQLQVARATLKRENDRQKSYADQHRSSRESKVGEKVFLRVKPKRSSLKLGKYEKLVSRYCRPFEIVKRVGEQLYQLALPPNLHVHDVFHVSLLKQYVANPEHVFDIDETILVNQEEFLLKSEEILESQEKKLHYA